MVDSNCGLRTLIHDHGRIHARRPVLRRRCGRAGASSSGSRRHHRCGQPAFGHADLPRRDGPAHSRGTGSERAGDGGGCGRVDDERRVSRGGGCLRSGHGGGERQCNHHGHGEFGVRDCRGDRGPSGERGRSVARCGHTGGVRRHGSSRRRSHRRKRSRCCSSDGVRVVVERYAGGPGGRLGTGRVPRRGRGGGDGEDIGCGRPDRTDGGASATHSGGREPGYGAVHRARPNGPACGRSTRAIRARNGRSRCLVGERRHAGRSG